MVQYIMYSVHCTVYIVHRTLYSNKTIGQTLYIISCDINASLHAILLYSFWRLFLELLFDTSMCHKSYCTLSLYGTLSAIYVLTHIGSIGSSEMTRVNRLWLVVRIIGSG